MKSIFALGLRGRLILLIVAAFAVIFVMIVLHTVAHRADKIANSTTQLLHQTKLIAARQQQIAARAETILSDLMLHPKLRPDASPEACAQLLAARAKQEPAFIQIGKVLPNGDMVCAAVSPVGHVNFADRAWLQQVLKSEKMLVSGVLMGRIVNQPIIVFAKAMRDDAGRVTGVLSLALDLNWLRQELAQTEHLEGTRLVVVDAKGKVVTRHPDVDGRVGKSAAQTPLLKAIAAHGGQGTVEGVGLEGTPSIIAFTPLLDTVSGPMTLWLSLPKAVIVKPYQDELILTLSVGLALLLLVMALVYWGGEKLLVQPLMKLFRAVARFGSGDLTARTGLIYTKDDIGRLAQAFDNMAESIQTGGERFRAVAEASLDALFILKSEHGEHGEILDFEFADINPRGEEMLGMARDKVVGQKLCELIPINRSGGFFDKYVAVVTTGTPLEEEFPIDTPEIKAKWLRHQVVRIGDGVAISSRDVTEWKAASAEIRRQGRIRTSILNSAGEGIFGLDIEGRATFVNPAAVAMLQWTEEELVGKPMHALHHHTRADGTPYPAEKCPIYAAYRDGETRRADDEVFWRKDGSSYPVEYISTPVRDEQGVLTGAVVSFSDISQRKAQEQALIHAARTLKTLSDVNKTLVHATDEAQLLEDVCRIIVEQGGYRMTWVAYADDNPEKTVTPKAWAGIEEGYLAQLSLTWADAERGRAPTSRAIRSGEVQVTHDIRSDPGFALWREMAEKHGYVANFSYPLTVAGKVIGALGIYSAATYAFDDDEVELLKELGGDLAFGIETIRTRAERDRTAYQHQHHAEILRHTLEDALDAIATTVEMRDPYTAGHERRVGELAVAIAEEMGLDEDKIHGIRLAASVHDLGKIQIPAEILSKPGKLSEIEFMLIKTHPQAGYDILKDVDFPWPIADIVWQHHERLDGTGYPQGLSDGSILIESRIMAVADVVEAMSSHRPYRPGLGIEVALGEIERGKGSAYDPAVADACLKLFREKGFAFQK